MNLFQSVLDEKLQQRKQQALYRSRRVIESAQDVRIVVDGTPYLSFCSNDYLGFANHPALKQRQQQAIEKYGCGSGASHLISGHSDAHHALENELAEFMQVERVLLFSTGYMANLGIANALLERHDAVFEDRLNHASLIDAGLMSAAKLSRYHHCDVAALQRQLQRFECRLKLVLTDAVFSMDGNIAPLQELIQVCQQEQAWLMIDDAHGFGVLGEHGRGSLEHFELATNDVPIYMATLGKAMGVAGAFVAGSENLIETLIQYSRPYIYTTAMPAVQAETLRESLALLAREKWRRDKLRELIQYFREKAQQLELPLLESHTPIQPLMIGDSQTALNLAEQLQQQGILISAIRPPTVPDNTARLRITFSANHELSDIDRLLAILDNLFHDTTLSAKE